MKTYHQVLDEIMVEANAAAVELDTISNRLATKMDELVREIHRLENGNIKEPMHVLHWRSGMFALQRIEEARNEVLGVLRLLAKNR